MSGAIWTPAEHDELVRRFMAGESVRAIALAMGRSPGTTKRKVSWLRKRGHDLPNRVRMLDAPHRALPKGREWTDAETERLVALRHEGKTYREIAVLLDRTKGSVQSRGRVHCPDPAPVAAPKPRRPRKAKPSSPRRVKPRVTVVHEAPPFEHVPASWADLLPLPEAQRLMARHIDRLGYPAPWTPQRDRALVTAVLTGAGIDAGASAAGVDKAAALARWRALTARILHPRAGLCLTGQATLAAELKRRAP